MKEITVPITRDPYVVEINNQKYAFKAGTTVIVEDEVAEVVAHELALVPEPEDTGPALEQPLWGAGPGLVKGPIETRYSYDEGTGWSKVALTQEEYDNIVACYWTIADCDEFPKSYLEYDPETGVATYGDPFRVSIQTYVEGRVYTQIPKEYLGGYAELLARVEALEAKDEPLDEAEPFTFTAQLDGEQYITIYCNRQALVEAYLAGCNISGTDVNSGEEVTAYYNEEDSFTFYYEIGGFTFYECDGYVSFSDDR